MNEQEKFLEELGVKEESILDKPLELPVEDNAEPKEESAEETEQKAKNRRERRLLGQLEDARKEVFMTNARLEAIKEAQSSRQNTEEADYLKLVDKIYGNATPEATEATELLKKALQGVHESARKEALDEAISKVREEREKESKEVQEEEKNLDEMLENLEEDHNADFSNEDTRRGFLNLLEKLSPKDRDGNILEYADPDTTWEIFTERTQKSSSRAKELASRSMTRSGASQESKLETDSTERFLRDNGII